ncbi:MAG: protein phosphatase 2C domain-containing protein [Oligoflexales bacterium]|nr:protein phosphatase 2C domain-containing protein [Oligoflexales bacterium]
MVALKQAILLFDQDMSGPETIVTEHYTLSYLIKRNPGSKVTEDSVGLFLFEDGSLVCGVADGIGGHRSGEKASRFAIEALHKHLKDQSFSLMKRMTLSFEDANQKVLDLGSGAGSTLVVGSLHDSYGRFYHAGDSIGVLLGGRGKVKYETTAHCPYGLGVEAGLINAEAHETVPEDLKYMVTNYIGRPDLRIEVATQQKLHKMDRIFLFSDGLSDNFRLNEMPVSQRPSEICSFVAKHALERMLGSAGKQDDLAFVAICQN